MGRFDQLDPVIRTYALVGRFLQGWAAMEIALHDAIGAALSIETTKMIILCANLRFRDKTNILRTLVDVSRFSPEEKTKTKVKLRKLGEHAGRRNMIAHEPFQADPNSTGVKFITIKAKGEFETPEIIWSHHRFDEEDRLLEGYTTFLTCLENKFKQTPLTRQNYTDALLPFLGLDIAGVLSTNLRTIPQALAGPQFRSALEHPDSGQATPQPFPQNPEKLGE